MSEALKKHEENDGQVDESGVTELAEMPSFEEHVENINKAKRYTEIDEKEAEDILIHCSGNLAHDRSLDGKIIIFPNSLYDQRPKYSRYLSVDKLIQSELQPRFKFQLEDVTYNTSRAFEVAGRDAVICYLETANGKTSVRSYYRSGSQGVWRYLPDYVQDKATGEIFYWGKGSSEQQLTLPMEIQGALNEIATQSQDKSADPGAEECFYRTAISVSPEEQDSLIIQRRFGNVPIDDLSEEVDPLPSITLSGRLDRLPPEAMNVNKELWPNFKEQVDEFDMKSEIYGDAKVRLFKSRNEELTWSFIEDYEGRVCIGGAEMKSKITSTGLRQKWVDAGDFATPLYEYWQQDYGLGDKEDTQYSYVGMWKNCLSRMPLIKAYNRAVHSEERKIAFNFNDFIQSIDSNW